MYKQNFLIIVMLLPGIIRAQSSITSFKPTRVAIFKNGTCFIKKEAEVNPVNGQFIIAPPDNVLYGTYWLSAGKAAGIKSVSVKTDSFAVDKPVVQMADAIAANTGRTITIRRTAYNGSSSVREQTGTVLGYDRKSETIRMQTADGKLLVSKLNSLEEVVADAGQTRFYKADSVGALARVTLDKQVGQATITSLGLYNGMVWHPSYLFQVLNDKEARLEMKATIENGGEAMRRMPVDLVVGNPNMFYGKKLDPVCLELMNLYLEGSTAGRANYLPYNAVPARNFPTQAINYALIDDEDAGGATNAGTAANGEKARDLYYFKLGQMDLEANSRTIVPVFSHTVSYKDVYEITIPHLKADDYTRSAVLQERKPLEVVHSFAFNNTTKISITSGAVLALDEKENPLAQEELKYTPAGAEGTIKLSKALDVQANNEEEVTDVQQNFKKINKDHYYDRVLLKGQIKIRNYQDKAIRVSVTKVLEGQAGTITNQGKATRLRQDDDPENPITIIKWELELNPGETKIITYDYTVLD